MAAAVAANRPSGVRSAAARRRCFDLGEGQLDRVEVRRVGRQEEEASTGRLDGRAGGLALVRAQVVQDDDLTGAQAGGEEALGVGREDGAIDRPRDRQGGTDACGREGGQQRHVRTVVTRDPPHRPRAPRARARRRVIAVWVLVSSTKIRSAGLSAAASSRHAVRAASSRSAAMSDFF